MAFDHRRFGPTRKEHVLRIALCVLVLALLVVAFVTKGAPTSLVASETFIIGGGVAFGVGGTSLWRLWRGDYRRPDQ